MRTLLRNILLPLVALTTTLTACETPVEFSGEEMESLPVIYSVVVPGEPIKVYYSGSVFILDDDWSTPQDVTNGTVELYINDTFVERLPYVEIRQEESEMPYYQNAFKDVPDIAPPTTIIDRCYLATATAKVGDKVTIRASSPRYPSWVSGTTVVPPAPVLGDFSASVDGKDQDEYLFGRAYFTITDDGDQMNYYWLRGGICWIPEGSNYIRNNTFSYTDTAFGRDTSNDIITDIIGDESSFVLFDDSRFNGEENFQLMVDWEIRELNTQYTPYFEAKCCNLSEDLYKYYRSVELSDSQELFGEPVQIYTNIGGGLGVVGARSEYTITQTEYNAALAR